MKCPNCEHSFKFSSVPLENRTIEAGSQTFMCPNCATWLKPDKRYTVYNFVATILLLLGLLSLAGMLALDLNLPEWLSSVFFIMGFALMIFSTKNIRLNTIEFESVLPIGEDMLELRPTCENCNTPLPPESTEAMICSFECTFCKACVENILHNVCPNCGGGFALRPIRPKTNWKEANFLGAFPASKTVKHSPVDTAEHEKFSARIKSMDPKER